MEHDTSNGFAFADRIAEVMDGTRFEGYLHVTVPELAKSSRTGDATYVDMVFARRDLDQPEHWRYEDRADPGTDSAQERTGDGAARLVRRAVRVALVGQRGNGEGPS
ncbi:hypothetical protein ACGFMK_13775 [Amycolatopsis sp. NPDC049252]|uniref:hypothetical protein n=1 Tax=Amycolatopsis sp. NPDC049252 TaxID=3363933 RepID=UPI00371EDB50